MKLCKEPGCSQKHHAKGWCRKHYKKNQVKEIGICVAEDCNKKTHAKNLCGVHYQRYRRYGDYTICYSKRDLKPEESKSDTSYRLPKGYFLISPYLRANKDATNNNVL